jgi:putative NADPH-quinone reductase
LKHSILGFCGIGPIRETLIGMIEASDNTAREKWLVKMRALGGEGR